MSKDNLKLWNEVCTTDPKTTKEIRSGGRKMTSIMAQHQLKRATEMFGPYGKGFGLKSFKMEYITGLVNDQMLATGEAIFFYPDGEFSIASSIFVQRWYDKKGYHAIDDDFAKKLQTDMTTKALSKLGFNADIFLGLYEDSKYVESTNVKYRMEEVKNHIAKINSVEDLNKYYTSNKFWGKDADIVSMFSERKSDILNGL
jgi:hypothetical protein